MRKRPIVERQRPVIMDVNPKSPISEAYRTLRTNIEFSSFDDELKTIMITSAQPAEGKTTTAVNLAVAFAQTEKKVLLIDADLRKPTIHHIFSKHNRGGLTNIISNRYQVRELIQETHIDNLSVITSGPIPPNPSEMLASNRMGEVIQELKQMYDIIVIDTPPALAVTDAQIMATKCDGVLLVANAGKVKRQALKRVKDGLDHVKARLLGVVLNNIKRKKGDDHYYYYYGSSEQESV
jgi:capsular exopolysaccharide synthesis family protein